MIKSNSVRLFFNNIPYCLQFKSISHRRIHRRKLVAVKQLSLIVLPMAITGSRREFIITACLEQDIETVVHWNCLFFGM